MPDTKGITILGLGPGDPNLVTRQAWEWLHAIPEVWLRTRRHPVVAALPGGLRIHSFDDLTGQTGGPEEIIGSIANQVVQLGARAEGVTYAVPGHPFLAEATTPAILRLAEQQGIPVRVLEGLSFLEPALTALGQSLFPQTSLVDALQLSGAHTVSFPPAHPALICQISSRTLAARVRQVLMEVYPSEHPVYLAYTGAQGGMEVETTLLQVLDQASALDYLTSLYLPPLAADTSFEAFQELVAHLRAPEGCPWDREQTHRSLRMHLLEETYEALEALDNESVPEMVEEFGDLLLQIVLHAQIGAEANTFRMADVIQGIHRKIVRRHPHVFGNIEVDGVGGVLANWETLKAAERSEKNAIRPKGILDGVPGVLPSLAQAQEIQDRAARVGFDWPEVNGVLEKIQEEIQEVLEAPDERALEGEVGDLLFAAVNLARWKKVDAEAALRETNQKFRRRFRYIETHAREDGRDLRAMTLEEMDRYWDAAKAEE